MLQYNPIENSFVTFESVQPPKVEYSLPLFDNPLDISNWASRVSEKTGNPIVKDNLKDPLVNDNPTQVEIYQQQPSESSTKKSISLSQNEKTNALYIMNYLVNNKEMSAYQAAGIVGNLKRESGLNAGAYNSNDVGLPGGGLGGFRGENFSKLKAFAKNNGKSWKDIDLQLEYIVSTIDNTTGDLLSKATNPREASEAWANYEKYAGYDGKLSSAKKWQKQNGWSDEKTKKWIENEHKVRGDYADEIYKLWKKETKQV